MKKRTIILFILTFLLILNSTMLHAASVREVRRKSQQEAEQIFSNLQEGTVEEALNYYVNWYETKIAELRQADASRELINELQSYMNNCQTDLSRYKEENPHILSIQPTRSSRTNEFLEAYPKVAIALWKAKNPQPQTAPEPEPKPAPAEKEEVMIIDQEIQQPDTGTRQEALVDSPTIPQQTQPVNPRPVKQDSFSLPIISQLKGQGVVIFLIFLCVVFAIIAIFSFVRYKRVLDYAHSLERKERELRKEIGFYEAFMRKVHSNIMGIKDIPTEEDLTPEKMYEKMVRFIKFIKRSPK
jgi:predicted Holliday junction resolvase-like endonuclease